MDRWSVTLEGRLRSAKKAWCLGVQDNPVASVGGGGGRCEVVLNGRLEAAGAISGQQDCWSAVAGRVAGMALSVVTKVAHGHGVAVREMVSGAPTNLVRGRKVNSDRN